MKTCKICSCSDSQACQNGCFWVRDDLCSNCIKKKNILNLENDEYWKIPILNNHNYSQEGILGNTKEFKIENGKYRLEPGYIKHKDGSVEILEVSIVKL